MKLHRCRIKVEILRVFKEAGMKSVDKKYKKVEKGVVNKGNGVFKSFISVSRSLKALHRVVRALHNGHKKFHRCVTRRALVEWFRRRMDVCPMPSSWLGGAFPFVCYTEISVWASGEKKGVFKIKPETAFV